MAYVSQELKNWFASSDFDLLCDFVRQGQYQFDFDIPNNRYKDLSEDFSGPKRRLLIIPKSSNMRRSVLARSSDRHNAP